MCRLRQALPQLVRAMEKACLGEAQAVVASRAEARNSPPNLIAALHSGASGASLPDQPSNLASHRLTHRKLRDSCHRLVTHRCKKRSEQLRSSTLKTTIQSPEGSLLADGKLLCFSDLFEGAAAELRPSPSQIASQRFRMFLALSSELHQVRARVHIAAQQSREGHPGAACADLLVRCGFRAFTPQLCRESAVAAVVLAHHQVAAFEILCLSSDFSQSLAPSSGSAFMLLCCRSFGPMRDPSQISSRVHSCWRGNLHCG